WFELGSAEARCIERTSRIRAPPPLELAGRGAGSGARHWRGGHDLQRLQGRVRQCLEIRPGNPEAGCERTLIQSRQRERRKSKHPTGDKERCGSKSICSGRLDRWGLLTSWRRRGCFG